MAITVKRISKVLIDGLSTSEQNAKKFLVTAESQSSNYSVTMSCDAKLSENSIEYEQANPIILPIIYGETFLYKAVIIDKNGRLSAEVIINDVRDVLPTAPNGITLTTNSYTIEAVATYSHAVTDILRHEWIFSNAVLSASPTIDTLPTHITEGNSKLIVPGKFTVSHTSRFWVRRVDSKGNISTWYSNDVNGTTSIDIIKIDIDTEILDTNNRILTTTEKTDLTNKTQNLTASGTIPNVNVSGLGALATKDSVDLNTAEVTNKSLANLDFTANTKLASIASGAEVNTVNTGDNISVFNNNLGFTDDTVANSKTKTYAQSAIPETNNVGDIWIDTDDNNKMYISASTNSVSVGVGFWEDKSVKANAISDIDTKISVNSNVVSNTAKVSDIDHVVIDLPNVENKSSATIRNEIVESDIPTGMAEGKILNLTTNLASKVPITRTVNGKALSDDVSLLKADVGLGNVDDTSDSDKPISTAQQTALDAKETPSGSQAKVDNRLSATEKTNLAAKKTIDGTQTLYHTGNKPNKADVGLGNVTNESKTTMFASPTFTGAVTGVTKTHVGLGNVDNKQQISVDDSISNLVRNGAFNTGTLDPFITSTANSSGRKIFLIDADSSGQNYAKINFSATDDYGFICQNIYVPFLTGQDILGLSAEIKRGVLNTAVESQISLFHSATALTDISTLDGLNSGSSEYLGRISISSVQLTNDFQRFETVITGNHTLDLYLIIKISADLINDSEGGGYCWFRNIFLNIGTVVPKFSEHPEDAIERRNIGEAAKLINDMFQITSSGKIYMKQNLYAIDGTTKIIDADTAVANTVATASQGAKDVSSGYINYNE